MPIKLKQTRKKKKDLPDEKDHAGADIEALEDDRRQTAETGEFSMPSVDQAGLPLRPQKTSGRRPGGVKHENDKKGENDKKEKSRRRGEQKTARTKVIFLPVSEKQLRKPKTGDACRRRSRPKQG